MNIQDELIKNYSQKSKHSNYQILPKVLEPILSQGKIEVVSRYERERLDFIMQNIGMKDKTVLDIGGNTGFFSFEIISAGAKSVHIYEGNKEHCDFVKGAIGAIKISNLTVTNDYYTFDNSKDSFYDVALLLNVLHHVGDDYDDQRLSIDRVKEKIIEQLNSMRFITGTLVFQLGFNWRGDIKQCLFEDGTKSSMIDFIKEGTKDYWDVVAIGVAEGTKQKAMYADLNEQNIQRNDSLGEFLNRPIFILKSRE